MKKVLKYRKEDYVKVVRVVTLGRRTPSTSLESLVFRKIVVVVDEDINKKAVVARRNYVVGKFLVYDIEFVWKAWNSLTRQALVGSILMVISRKFYSI